VLPVGSWQHRASPHRPTPRLIAVSRRAEEECEARARHRDCPCRASGRLASQSHTPFRSRPVVHAEVDPPSATHTDPARRSQHGEAAVEIASHRARLDLLVAVQCGHRNHHRDLFFAALVVTAADGTSRQRGSLKGIQAASTLWSARSVFRIFSRFFQMTGQVSSSVLS